MLNPESAAMAAPGVRIRNRSAEAVRANRLMHIETATNRYRLPGGSRRKIAREVNREFCNFLRLDHPFYSSALNRARVERLHVHPEALGDFADSGRTYRPSCPGRTGADHIAGNPVL